MRINVYIYIYVVLSDDWWLMTEMVEASELCACNFMYFIVYIIQWHLRLRLKVSLTAIGFPILDGFSEKLRTPSFQKTMLIFFRFLFIKNYDQIGPNITQYYPIEPNVWTKFMIKMAIQNLTKSATKLFWSELTPPTPHPPPNFGVFPKFIQRERNAPLG